MRAVDRVARLGDRLFDRIRDQRAFTLTDDEAVEGGFESLRGQTYAVVVTFRRDGTAVPSPVWLGVDDAGRAYFHTAPYAGKTKRIEHDPRALLAPSTLRGRPTGPAVRGLARVLPREEWPHAEATLASAYGVVRRLFARGLLRAPTTGVYVEVTPVGD